MKSSIQIIIYFNTASEYSLFENFFSYIYRIKNQFNFLFLSFFCKKIKKFFNNNKSPFVNNKSKDQYSFHFYKGKITFKVNFIIINYQIYKLLYIFFKKNILLYNKIFTRITFKKISKYF